MAAKSAKKEIGFEEGLSQLETIAEQMEKNDLPLEKLLDLYEQGMKLSAELSKKLEAAKGRMLEVKQGKDGKPVTEKTELMNQETLLSGLEEGE
ncbi:MAG: exodeoxyribonuclease VII small subunit [Clostridia bacterium]